MPNISLCKLISHGNLEIFMHWLLKTLISSIAYICFNGFNNLKINMIKLNKCGGNLLQHQRQPKSSYYMLPIKIWTRDYVSVAEYLPIMLKALSSIPSIMKNKKEIKIKLGTGPVTQLAECLSSMLEPWLCSPAPNKPAMTAYGYNASTQETEVGRSWIQNHFQPHWEFVWGQSGILDALFQTVGKDLFIKLHMSL